MKRATDNNKFLKVLIAAQRAKQIRKGAQPLIQDSTMRPTRIALEEVERELISFDFSPQDLRDGRDNQAASRQDSDGESNQETANRLSVALFGN